MMIINPYIFTNYCKQIEALSLQSLLTSSVSQFLDSKVANDLTITTDKALDFDATTEIEIGAGRSILSYYAEVGVTPVISGTKLKTDIAGYVCEVILDDGTHLVLQTNDSTVYDVATDTAYTVNGTVAYVDQNLYQYNNIWGYSLVGSVYVSASQLNLYKDVLGNTLTTPAVIGGNDVNLVQSNAVSLNGFDNYIDLLGKGFSTGTGDWYIEWYGSNITAGNQKMIVDGYQGSNLGFYLGYYQNKAYFLYGDDVNFNKISSVIDSETHLMRMGVDSINEVIYLDIDGVRKDSKDISAVTQMDFDLTQLFKLTVTNNFYGRECFSLKFVKDGIEQFYFPFAEGDGSIVYDVISDTAYTFLGTVNSSTRILQDIYHYNINNGFTLSGSTFLPASQTNIGYDVLGNTLTNPAIPNGYNGAETLYIQNADNVYNNYLALADTGNLMFDASGNPKNYDIKDINGNYNESNNLFTVVVEAGKNIIRQQLFATPLTTKQHLIYDKCAVKSMTLQDGYEWVKAENGIIQLNPDGTFQQA